MVQIYLEAGFLLPKYLWGWKTGRWDDQEECWVFISPYHDEIILRIVF